MIYIALFNDFESFKSDFILCKNFDWNEEYGITLHTLHDTAPWPMPHDEALGDRAQGGLLSCAA